MNKILLVISLVILMVGNVLAGDFNQKGNIELSAFPINDEHGVYARWELYQQVGYKNIYVFTNPRLCFSNDIVDTTRTDRSYITSWEPFNRGYFDEWTSGVGYTVDRNVDIRIIYVAHRLPDGYEGDWSGIQVRVNWGK